MNELGGNLPALLFIHQGFSHVILSIVKPENSLRPTLCHFTDEFQGGFTP
jgi:hypothetical protein